MAEKIQRCLNSDCWMCNLCYRFTAPESEAEKVVVTVRSPIWPMHCNRFVSKRKINRVEMRKAEELAKYKSVMTGKKNK